MDSRSFKRSLLDKAKNSDSIYHQNYPLISTQKKEEIQLQKKKINYAYYLLLLITLVVLISYFIIHNYHVASFSQSPTSAGIETIGMKEVIREKLYPTRSPVNRISESTIPTKQETKITKDLVFPTTNEVQLKSKSNEKKKSIPQKGKKSMNLQERMTANSKKQRKFGSDQIYDYQSDWGYNGKEKYIEVLPTLKIPLKKDRRVVFPNLVIGKPSRPPGSPSQTQGQPRALMTSNEILKKNILYANPSLSDGSISLDEVMVTLQKQETCAQKPIFLTMATVGDDLYWQLIENFVYTMVKFSLSACSIVICVSDANCMKLCRDSFFPCYNYQERITPLPSVMEQIGRVKLFYVPMALTKGVDVFMLDLDVGFLGDPNIMVEAFVQTPIVDILVQEDYIFIMNRTRAGWKQWFTEPLPNIGLFLCRGNNRTARVFDISWQKYQMMDDAYEKAQPGKDQNHVLEAMRIGRGTFALKYAYFGNWTAPLLDKLVLNHGNVMELGGELMESFLIKHHSLAIHTTCYEKSTKVMGLKAANAFWNPKYYDPLRPTITKQLIYKNDRQLLDEVRSLIWLGMVTDRSVIIPNVLGPDELSSRMRPYHGQMLWPGYRVVYLKRTHGKNDLKVNILEPAFYWRVNRDYDEVPLPKIIYYDAAENNLSLLKDIISQEKDSPRIILAPNLFKGKSSSGRISKMEDELRTWADDSVGTFPVSYDRVKHFYRPMPSVKGVRSGQPLVADVLNGMRTCAGIFDPPRGNRTCFQICK